MTPVLDYVTFECTNLVETSRNDPDEREAVAYADIDGYPDSDKEGTVICRVWMIRNRNANSHSQKFNFIVDWHWNAYRGNETVIGLIRQAKEDLKVFFNDTVVERVFRSAYNKYKMRWMLDNGHTFTELFAKMQAQMDNGAKTIEEAFAKFEELSDFNGVFWDSEYEFRCDEWKNDDYMRKLLNSEEYGIWRDQ